MLAVLLTMLLPSVFASCSLQCPNVLTKNVDDKCMYKIEDLRNLVQTDCIDLQQTGLGGYFPRGEHTLQIKNSHTSCDVKLNVIDNMPPVIHTVRGEPNLMSGNNKWEYVNFHFKKFENCCGVFCNITHVEYEDNTLNCSNGDSSDSHDSGDSNDGSSEGHGRRFFRRLGLFPSSQESSSDGDDCTKETKQAYIVGDRTVKLCSTKKVDYRTYKVTGMCYDDSNLYSARQTTVVTFGKTCDKPDPSCERNLLGKDGVCCPVTCGECGGQGCGSRPGGEDQCCTSKVLQSNRNCSKYNAPCVV